MISVLQLLPSLPNLKYEVRRHGNIYVAGVAYAHFHAGRIIFADLYLDRMGRKQVRLWRPRIINPFHTETKEVDKRVREFYIDNLLLNWHSFKYLVENMDEHLFEKYRRKIGFADAEAFFL